jgi:polar amino acid transport system ATP-binding protein
MASAEGTGVPVIDVSALVEGTAARTAVAAEIGQACRAQGFFYVTGHGVDQAICDRLVAASRRFFALDRDTKMQWRMSLGGRAWRGYFPAGGSERPRAGPTGKKACTSARSWPTTTRSCAPARRSTAATSFRRCPAYEAVLAYLDALTRLGHALMEGVALSLGLDAAYFADRYTADPLILFRIFNYPSRPAPAGQDVQWGVGEHSDYGLLTILWQDGVGGLQVKTPDGWVDARPLPRSFVCNIGDMLDRMTGGLYRSTPHRVALNTTGRDRLSMPFFFDPHFEARVRPIEGLTASAAAQDRAARWDGANIHAFDGTYGDYLLGSLEGVPQRARCSDRLR